jgi:hypothetical protein
MGPSSKPSNSKEGLSVYTQTNFQARREKRTLIGWKSCNMTTCTQQKGKEEKKAHDIEGSRLD